MAFQATAFTCKMGRSR